MSKGKKIGLIVFIVIVVFSALAAFFITKIQDDLEYLMEMPVEDVDLTAVEDGTYVGEFEITLISVIVEVVVQDNEIESISILKHDSGQGFDAETIVEDVVINQSIEVDSVAGATYSSKAILLAIKDALS